MSGPVRDKGPAADRGEGFLQKIIALFTGIGDPESEKRKLLRAIGRELGRSRYRFYRPKGQEALQGLAKFFYEIYRIVAPAQVFLGNAAGSTALRSFVIDSFLNEEQAEIAERLTEAHIIERSKSVDIRGLQTEVKDDIASFMSIFDSETTRSIDGIYSSLVTFINFVNFDYYFMLKKFDSALGERNFAYHPKFESINGEYVAEDLQDFLEVFEALDLSTDWKRVFAIFKEYKKADVVQIDVWSKMIPVAEELRRSQVLPLIVRHLKKDPNWAVQPRYQNERIVEPYLVKLKTQIETLFQRLVQEQRNSRVDELAKLIFGTTAVLRMKNYTDKANAAFAKRMLGGFIHTQPMNYLKAYLMDYFKKDVRELADLLLVRGQWTTNLQSQQLSENYHGILDLADQILQFDESLADESELGTRLRSLLARAERDRDAMAQLRTSLRTVNDRAGSMISRTALGLIAVGRHLKVLIEDYSKPHRALLLNWKELEAQSAQPFKERMVDVYKKLYYMVQLLQFFSKEEAKASPPTERE